MRKRLQFLRQWRFWLNYAFILAVTSWVPLLTQKATMTLSDGKVLQESTTSVRAYQSWYMLFTHGPGVGQGQAVATHLGLCFAVTAFVWFIMFRPIIQDLPDPVITREPAEDAPPAGDAPHE